MSLGRVDDIYGISAYLKDEIWSFNIPNENPLNRYIRNIKVDNEKGRTFITPLSTDTKVTHFYEMYFCMASGEFNISFIIITPTGKKARYCIEWDYRQGPNTAIYIMTRKS